MRKEVNRELGRLSRIGRESMESQVIRTYLETIAELPWTERTAEHLDLPEAARILDEDHYALGDVKDRVLEFLAVRQLRDQADKAEKARDNGEVRRARRVNQGREDCPGPDHGQPRRQGLQGPDPALRRPSRRRQDVGRQVDRPRDGSQVRPDLARRGA